MDFFYNNLENETLNLWKKINQIQNKLLIFLIVKLIILICLN